MNRFLSPDFQIIIPMSGSSKRFFDAGYSIPKPLIKVEDRPIIAHVVEMFPGEKNFIFICNQDHLENKEWKMEETLKYYCPSGQIYGISPHKLGPVYAVLQAEHLIDPERPVIINYCDFSCYWHWKSFKKFVYDKNCSGAIPAYKGFHPHSLGNTNYAYMLESKGMVMDIREKKPYTDNRMEEFASSGTYYFSKGSTMLSSFHESIKEKRMVEKEYYVSLAYKSLLERKEPVAIYPLLHFMQWGTPEDLKEYKSWSRAFRQLIASSSSSSKVLDASIIPMAGLGKRFTDEGYSVPKPLISVSGKSMAVQAMNDLPPSKNKVFILRKDMTGYNEMKKDIKKVYSEAFIESIEGITEGQACTALLGLKALEKYNKKIDTVTFGTCDNGVLYNSEKFNHLMDNKKVDVIVWGVRNHLHAIRKPEMFSWIKEKEGVISKVSVKSPLKSPENDPIVIGTFTFIESENAYKCINNLIKRNGRVNGEYYLDSCINDAIEMGLGCYLFEVDSFISRGTPNDLKTFEYWQSCFHKWSSHPYCLKLDHRIPFDALKKLEKKYDS